ncbi:urease accessory protein UreD [Gordonia sp. CPCC 206044]|uniref:urease accessory protein UreD n=1 Tax=Gordonia sp. CPCC 206044 TaxID=3140793 RepID=UPI003AF36563
MHTEVEIVAVPGRSPRTRSIGGLAVRQTGPDTVHLIGTAATPLGGDTISVRVSVAAGAALTIRTVAATIALPARERLDSRMDWHIDVGDGARLRVDPEPTIVAGGAHHHTATHVTAHPDATVVIAEHAQLGRAEETPEHLTRAQWDGALHIDIGGTPLLRHRLALGGPERTHGAVGSVFRYPDTRPAEVSATAYATRLDLARPAGVAGSTLTTALAATAAAARALCDEIELTSVSVAP